MWPFRKKTLKEHLSQTKVINVRGVLFEIKRISILDHAKGLNVLQKIYDVYTVDRKENTVDDAQYKKMKSIYTDIIDCGVIKPKLTRKDDGLGIPIESIFEDFYMAEDLATEILNFTYGKKKVK